MLPEEHTAKFAGRCSTARHDSGTTCIPISLEWERPPEDLPVSSQPNPGYIQEKEDQLSFQNYHPETPTTWYLIPVSRSASMAKVALTVLLREGSWDDGMVLDYSCGPSVITRVLIRGGLEDQGWEKMSSWRQRCSDVFRSWTPWHLLFKTHFGHLTSRTVKEQMCVPLSHQLCGHSL